MKWKPVEDVKTENKQCRAWVKYRDWQRPDILWIRLPSLGGEAYLTDHSPVGHMAITHYCPIPEPTW